MRHAAMLLTLSLIASLTSGCATSLLESEFTIEELAPLARAEAELTNHTFHYPTSRPDEPDILVAVHQIDPPEDVPVRETTILMIHGVWADADAWRYLTPTLSAAGYPLLLVDLPGAGESGAPNPKKLEDDGYGPTAMADRVMQAIDQHLEVTRAKEARANPQSANTDAVTSVPSPDEIQPARPIAIVAHSLGGAVTIQALTEPAIIESHRSLVDQITQLILVAPLDAAVHKADADIKKLATISGFALDVGAITGSLKDACRKVTAEGFGAPHLAAEEEAAERYEVVRDGARRRALQAHLLQAVPFDDFKPDWERIEELTARYTNLHTQTLIVWGTRDEVLPLSMGYKMAAELPSAQLIPIPFVKHSPHLERPYWLADSIHRFINGLPLDQPPAEIHPDLAAIQTD